MLFFFLCGPQTLLLIPPAVIPLTVSFCSVEARTGGGAAGWEQADAPARPELPEPRPGGRSLWAGQEAERASPVARGWKTLLLLTYMTLKRLSVSVVLLLFPAVSEWYLQFQDLPPCGLPARNTADSCSNTSIYSLKCIHSHEVC